VNLAPVCTFGAAPLTSNLLGDIAALSRPLSSQQCAESNVDFGADWITGPSQFTPFGAVLTADGVCPREVAGVCADALGSVWKRERADTPASSLGGPGRAQLHAMPPPAGPHIVYVEPHPLIAKR